MRTKSNDKEIGGLMMELPLVVSTLGGWCLPLCWWERQ